MLMRLQDALGLNDLSELVLKPGHEQASINGSGDRDEINLVVGFDGSPESHTALDLVLWIAHQTRLVTPTRVIVHAVYVVESEVNEFSGRFNSAWADERYFPDHHRPKPPCFNPPMQETLQTLETELNGTTFAQPTPYALKVLEQACQLAEEWGGAFDTHLQFGDIASGLRTVVEAENGVLLALGCCSANHSIVQQLQTEVACPVLGIPSNHIGSSPY